MLEWFSHPSFTKAVLLASTLILAWAVVWTVFTAWRRSRSLAQQDPPTEQELEAVRALRLAGPFRLPGRSSAAARHFEQSRRKVGDTSRGGGRGCYEPAFVQSWRDRRTPDDRGG